MARFVFELQQDAQEFLSTGTRNVDGFASMVVIEKFDPDVIVAGDDLGLESCALIKLGGDLIGKAYIVFIKHKAEMALGNYFQDFGVLYR